MKHSPLFWCALGAALCFNTIASADISYVPGSDYDILYGNNLTLEDTKGAEASGIWSELTPSACTLSGVSVDGSVTVTPTGNVFSLDGSDEVCRVKLVDHEGVSDIQGLRIGRRGLITHLIVNDRGYDGTDTVTATGVGSANNYAERVPGDDVTISTGTLPASFSLFAHFDSSAYDSDGGIFWSPASQLPNAGNYRFYTQGIGEWGGILTGSDANKYFLNQVSSQQFNINKVNLSVECQDNSVNYLAAAPQYVAVVSGFVNGEGPSDLDTEPTCSSDYAPGDREGTYAITGTGGASENYEFEYLDGTLTVIDNRPEGGGALSLSSARIAQGGSTDISLSSTVPGNWSIAPSEKFTTSLTGGAGTNDTVTLTGNAGQVEPGTEDIVFTFTPTDVSFKPTTHNFQGTLPADLDSNFGGYPAEGSVGGSFDLPNTDPYSMTCGCSEYTSSNTSVATVTSDGVISFVAEGNVLISWTSTTFGGDVQRTFSVSSSAPTPTGGSATVPGAPTGVTATAGSGEATVSWTAPASNGGAEITGYTVTASPGGATCTTTGATSCTVPGLTNGTAYTFTVTATNSAGTGTASSQSSAVTPTANAALTPTLGLPTSTADGFTAQVSNYDGAYTWAVSTTAGSATINGSGLVTVTGLNLGESATVTVTTTRDGYESGSETVTGSATATVRALPVPTLPMGLLMLVAVLLGGLGLRRLRI